MFTTHIFNIKIYTLFFHHTEIIKSNTQFIIVIYLLPSDIMTKTSSS